MKLIEHYVNFIGNKIKNLKKFQLSENRLSFKKIITRGERTIAKGKITVVL